MCWITSIDGESRLSIIPFADITHNGTFYKSIEWRAKLGLTKLALQCGDLSFASKYFKCCYTLLDLHTRIVPDWKFAAESLKTFYTQSSISHNSFFYPFSGKYFRSPWACNKILQLSGFFPLRRPSPPPPPPLTGNHNIVQKRLKLAFLDQKYLFLGGVFLRVFLPP